MLNRSFISVIFAAILLTGCASIKQNRDVCITVGVVAGALAGSSENTESAIGAAVIGGAAAWLICRTDSDGDGVLDEDDRCPGTPAGAQVDGFGCALDTDGDGVSDQLDACPNTERGATVDSRGCDKDTDGDGVRDDLDRCWNTPPGTQVDEAGCTLDTDQDGVPDSADSCPNTAPGKAVNAKGCHVVYTLSGVHFDFASAELSEEAQAQLATVSALLNDETELNVEILGHTDSQGPAAFNLKLSQQRADAVLTFLTDNGISAARLTAIGKGEDMPIADNSNEKGRMENRRVEFRVAD